ncbi:MAG: M48 family metalloprotease [Gemmatimonadales bacterium]|nr:M48 family metalloprotease [Gemmatimonadales bacterium]
MRFLSLNRLWPAAALLAACAVNPATGKKELSLVGEGQEIALGEETAASTRATIGLYPNTELQRYVGTLGQKLAAISERPSLPWSFEVIDDPEVNAFAAPGGKIFVTRGILPFLDSEAELAGVLGHEIGHVTARHSARQITRQQLATVGLVAGSLLSDKVAQMAGGLQAGLGILFLSYSRGDESQADELGFRYMRRGAFDVREMPNVFAALGRVGSLAGGGKVPAWQSSHPDPADRQAKAEQRARGLPADSLRGAIVNHDGYLRAIDGIVFGANPRQGYFDGTRFLHPDLRFRFEFPSGWKTVNRADAVVGASAKEDAVIQLSLGGQLSPEAALQKFAQQQGVQTSPAERVTVNGLSGVTSEFQVQDPQQGTMAGRVLFVTYGGNTYQMLGYTTGTQYPGYSGVLRQSLQSFGSLTDPAALNRQPAHLSLVRVPRAMTIEEFHRQYPSTVRMEVIAAINGVKPGETIAAGTTVKRVQ